MIYENSQKLSAAENIQPSFYNDSHATIDNFDPFVIQNEIISRNFLLLKSQYPISSPRLVKLDAIQTNNPIPLFNNSLIQTTPDIDTVFVEPVEFLLHAEVN